MLHKPIKTIYFTINFITTDELTSYYQFSYSSVSKTLTKLYHLRLIQYLINNKEECCDLKLIVIVIFLYFENIYIYIYIKLNLLVKLLNIDY